MSIWDALPIISSTALCSVFLYESSLQLMFHTSSRRLRRKLALVVFRERYNALSENEARYKLLTDTLELKLLRPRDVKKIVLESIEHQRLAEARALPGRDTTRIALYDVSPTERAVRSL